MMMKHIVMERWSILVLLLLPVVVFAANGSDDDGCPPDLECLFNSPCVKGDSDDLSAHPIILLEFENSSTSKDGYHCACDYGRTGIDCGRTFESCGDGEHTCYHDGKCIPGLTDIYGNTQLFCDCREAEHDGQVYVGKYCEKPALKVCDESDRLAKGFFCVNGGTCKDDFKTATEGPCDCLDGFQGPHCEYHSDEVPDCDLECENGGVCQLGVKEYNDAPDTYNHFWDNHDNGMYCSCPSGFFGLNCEITSEKCGGIHCFHNAECVISDKQNGPDFFCDCNTAATDEKSYTGQFCQYESTSFCSKLADKDGMHFCANGGICKDDPMDGCECPDGFNGAFCDVHDTELVSEYHASCTLECGEGECRNGAKDTSYINQFGSELAGLNISYDENFEHCVCPEGLTGEHCEIQTETCGDGPHICLHGAQCVPAEGGGYTCDCESAFTDSSRFAGAHCQHPHTTICTTSGEPEFFTGPAAYAFCVNNGTCVDVIKENRAHPGCNCPPGFGGPHCERFTDHLGSGSSAASVGGGASDGLVTFLAVFGVFFVVLTAVVTYQWNKERNLRKAYEEEVIVLEPEDGFPREAFQDDPIVDMGPRKDYEGNILEDVDIM